MLYIIIINEQAFCSGKAYFFKFLKILREFLELFFPFSIQLSRVMLPNTVVTSHMWLFKFKLNI